MKFATVTERVLPIRFASEEYLCDDPTDQRSKRRTILDTREGRLVAAVLEQAFADLRSHHAAICREACEYFFSRVEERWPYFTLIHCCDYLSLDPHWIREVAQRIYTTAHGEGIPEVEKES